MDENENIGYTGDEEYEDDGTETYEYEDEEAYEDDDDDTVEDDEIDLGDGARNFDDDEDADESDGADYDGSEEYEDDGDAGDDGDDGYSSEGSDSLTEGNSDEYGDDYEGTETTFGVPDGTVEAEPYDGEVIIAGDNEYIDEDRDELVDDFGNIKLNAGSDNAFSLEYVSIDDILVPDRIRHSYNPDALVTSIRSTGLLNPILVAPTATEGVYALVNGYGRLIACAKAGIKKIPCVVNCKVRSTEIRILEAMCNHYKPYSIKDMLDFIDYLENDKGILNPATIEYLLQMDPGDYTKLKDIIADDDENIVTPLMNGQLTIAAAFKKLESRRKKESREDKEKQKAGKAYQDDAEEGTQAIHGMGQTGSSEEAMDDDQLKEAGLTMDDIDAGDESLEDMVQAGKEMEGYEPHQQDWKNREKLDPALRKAVLARDNNTSRIDPKCSGPAYADVMDVHHIHEVYLGGNDDIDNLITVDIISHKLIHLWARGDLHLDNIDQMSEDEQEKFKKIIKLGNIIREDMKAKGMSREELRKHDKAETIGRTKPGTGQEAG